MAALVSIQSMRALRTVGLGYLIFGCMVTALFFCLDYLDVDKDVKYSQDHAEYWLGLPVCIDFKINLFYKISGVWKYTEASAI